MYTPKHNAERDLDVIRGLVRDHGFATMIVPRSDGQLEISHLPFLLTTEGRDDVLRVHVARANPIWREALSPERRGDIVIVFNGPHGYVSPTWYERGREDVPTWNYAVVHAHVTAPKELTHDEVYAQLDRLADTYESGDTRWRLDEHPAESRESLMRAIVGLHLPVARWEAKLKLSQNRTPVDHARVVAAFERRGTDDDRAMATMMKR